MTNKLLRNIIFGIIFLFISLIVYECKFSRYDYYFHIPEANKYVFMKKKIGGKFFLMFTESKEEIKNFPDIDYLETEITWTFINVYFDTTNTSRIHFHIPTTRPYSVNKKKYDFIEHKKSIKILNADNFLSMSVYAQEYSIWLDDRWIECEELKRW